MSRSQFRYKSTKQESGPVIKEILNIKERHPRFGVPRVTALLRRRGLKVNHKRVYRILKKISLLVPQKRRPPREYFPASFKAPVASGQNQVWSIDFITDHLANGSKYRCFTGIDLTTRISTMIHPSVSMEAGLPVKVLNGLRLRGIKPDAIILDNGTEFTSLEFMGWSKRFGVKLHFIDPGQPVQNAYIESFHSRFRDEVLNHNKFANIEDAKATIDKWRKYYNEERPHSSLKYLTPKEFAESKMTVINDEQKV